MTLSLATTTTAKQSFRVQQILSVFGIDCPLLVIKVTRSLARRLEVSHKYLFQRSVNFLARSEMEREETLQFAARRRFYQSPSNVFFSWIIALQMVGVGSH
jgi:hypothetical protein